MADKGDIWVTLLIVAAVVYGVSSCKEEPKAAVIQSNITSEEMAISAAGAVARAETSLPKPVIPPPSPNYETVEDGVYYYVATPSEEQRKRGINTGSVLAFRYFGKNQNGDHMLVQVYDNGSMGYVSTCSVPCKLIRDGNGRRTAYRPSSIIGAAFEDAMGGFLESTKPKLRTVTQEQQFEEPDVDQVMPPPPPPVIIEPVTQSETNGVGE